MELWYVMRTVPGEEEKAAALMRETVDPALWNCCRNLKKQKLFRTDGKLILSTEPVFPGYLFVKSNDPKELKESLSRAKAYPHLLGNGEDEAVQVAPEDLQFLKQICGDQLDQPMGLSEVEADEEGNLIRIKGILKPYSGKIIRKRLRKRYVLAEVGLFGRQETILFGICLPGDRIWQGQRQIQQGTFLRQ